MAAPTTGPCAPWVTWGAVSGYCDPPELPGSDAQQATMQAAIISAVSRELWVATCRQFGLCTLTRVRIAPCCTHHRAFCSCGAYYYLELGQEPIVSIEGVWIDGDLVTSSDYRVDDFARLVRIDETPWPTCSDLGVAQGEDRTFEVSFTFGLAIPPEGVMAAALLVCQAARDVVGDCEPPANAQTVAREGITIQLRAPGEKIETGVAFVDKWLASFSCAQAGIFDPGAKRSMVRIGT